MMNGIIEELKSKRKETGASQKSIANQIGVTKEIVGKWENGKRGITLKNAIKYAQAVGLELVLAERGGRE